MSYSVLPRISNTTWPKPFSAEPTIESWPIVTATVPAFYVDWWQRCRPVISGASLKVGDVERR
jgi:hypothetical protein